MSYSTLAHFERLTPHNDFDDSGGKWQLLFDALIGLRPLNGRERLEAAQIEANVTHRVWMHWQDGLKPQDRFRVRKATLVNEEDEDAPENFRVFQLESVINVGERNRELELMVVEKV